MNWTGSLSVGFLITCVHDKDIEWLTGIHQTFFVACCRRLWLLRRFWLHHVCQCAVSFCKHIILLFLWYKVNCSHMGDVFLWYKVKLFSHGGGVFVVQSELFSHGGCVFVVQSEAVLSWRRCFCGTKWSCSLIVFLWYKVKLFSHGGGVFVVQSEAVLSWRRCFCGTKWSCSLMGEVFLWYKVNCSLMGEVFLWYKVNCSLMGEVFLWYKVKLFSHGGGVFVVHSEAVLSSGRWFSSTK